MVIFYFIPIWGNDSHFDVHIFQRGWFNHQLASAASASLEESGLSAKKTAVQLAKTGKYADATVPGWSQMGAVPQKNTFFGLFKLYVI